MKLIKRTYIETFLWLIPVLLIGSIFSFYMIKYIVYEETDEHLVYEMERLIEHHQKYNDLPEYHKVAHITENMYLEQPLFKDTLILEEHDNEMIPHRELLFSLQHHDKYFTITLRQLLPGNDDIMEGALLMMLGLLVLISLCLFLMLHFVSERLWSPFYKILNILSKYKITEKAPQFPLSRIDEFNSLNSTIEKLLEKINNDYQRIKEFNENASHELQTHLSIIRLQAEKLLNSQDIDDSSLEQVQSIINAATKLSLAQKSLLLLSKIGNLEYNQHTYLNLAEHLENTIDLFEEAMNLRNIRLTKHIENNILYIDTGLAEILLNNLIKNAIKHNFDNGYINIQLKKEYLIIENSGTALNTKPNILFNRFAIGVEGNLGLGLAIVKQICELYNYKISYQTKGEVHKIQIYFS